MARPLPTFLDEISRRKGILLLGLDFDGTLAPLKPRPELARLPPLTKRLLRRLSRRRGVRLAVVSGRALTTLREKTGLRGIWHAGNHGLEIAGPGLRWTHPGARRAQAALTRAAAALAPLLAAFPGARLEEKGLSLSVHARALKGSAAALRRVLQALARREPRLRLAEGKKVFELRPRVDWDKGRALELIARRLPGRARIAFIGDDLSDEEGFRRLGPRALTARVGPGPTAARYRIKNLRQVAIVLYWISREVP